MKIRELALCRDCVKDLAAAQLAYKPVPGHEGEEPVCVFCRQKRFTGRYAIQYGREGVK